MRCMKQSHVQRTVMAQRGADFAAQTRCSHPIRTKLHQIAPAADITAVFRNPAAGVFDQRTGPSDPHRLRRLKPLNELAVAVVDKNYRFRLFLANGTDNFADFFHRQRRTQAVSARTLDMYQLNFGMRRSASRMAAISGLPSFVKSTLR